MENNLVSEKIFPPITIFQNRDCHLWHKSVDSSCLNEHCFWLHFDIWKFNLDSNSMIFPVCNNNSIRDTERGWSRRNNDNRLAKICLCCMDLATSADRRPSEKHPCRAPPTFKSMLCAAGEWNAFKCRSRRNEKKPVEGVWSGRHWDSPKVLQPDRYTLFPL